MANLPELSKNSLELAKPDRRRLDYLKAKFNGLCSVGGAMWRNPKSWKWKWLVMQVMVPLVVPIVVSALAAMVWEIGQPSFHMDMKVVADITPWALVFFTMALLGGGFYDLWADWASRAALSISLLSVAFVVLVYASFIVIWRHNPAFVPGTGVYILALILLAATVAVCHEAARV